MVEAKNKFRLCPLVSPFYFRDIAFIFFRGVPLLGAGRQRHASPQDNRNRRHKDRRELPPELRAFEARTAQASPQDVLCARRMFAQGSGELTPLNRNDVLSAFSVSDVTE